MSAPLDIQLGRLDLVNIGANRRACVAVLHSSKGKKAKVVTGGEDGVLQCFAVKKGETQMVFKNAPGKREVTALTIGGPAGSKDRIYAAFGQTIQGVAKKKGNQFFLYSAVLHEDISSLFVEDLTIYTACEYSLNVFEANKNGDQVSDVHFYQSPDRVHAMATTRVPGPGNSGSRDNSWNSVLACQDKHVRVVKDSDLYYQSRVDGAVLSVAMYDGPAPPEKKKEELGTMAQAKHFKINSEYKPLVYGTENGLVGQYLLDSSAMRPGWVWGQGKRLAGVTSLALADITLSGFDDVVVGRDDGSVEVYPYDSSSGSGSDGSDGDGGVEAVFTRCLNESITSITRGQVLASNSQDLVVSTFGGKVLAFTHELRHSNVAHIAPKVSNVREGAGPGSSSGPPLGLPGTVTNADGSSTNVMRESGSELDQSIKDLKLELEKLAEKVTKEKERYASKVSSELIAVEQMFKLKSGFKLLAEEACYQLTLEADMSLDVVALQSGVPVMLLDVESSGAMLSRSERDEKGGNELLAVYRCGPEQTSRLQIKLRTVEGQHGALAAYVIPKLAPKTCQRVELRIKPLSLHEKVHKQAIENELKTRPLSTLTLTGSFSLSDVHSWVSFCLPDVPSKAATDGPGGVQCAYFRSSFLSTVLSCDYEKGRAVFRSDSLTAVSILKEVVTREATAKKIAIAVDLDLNTKSAAAALQLLRPELDKHFTLAKRHALLAPLREIATHELAGGAGAGAAPGGAPGGAATGGGGGGGALADRVDELSQFLQPSYVSILRDGEAIEAALKQAPRHLDFLRGIVTDLFVDLHKLQGRSAQSRVPQLLEILENYSFEKLIAAFKD